VFNKKKSNDKPAAAPIPVQILTTEYLIEGSAPGDQQYYLPTGSEYFSPIELSGARLTAAGGEGIPARTMDRFEVKGDAVVALIVGQDPAGMRQFESYLNFRNALKGTFFVGPYLMEGTLMAPGSDQFNHALLITDAVIRHSSPKSKIGELRAPYVLINTHWLHGREVK
jgi:hypothetical protein